VLTVTFDVAGEQQYVRAFEAFDEELRDLRDPLGDVADHLRDVVGEQFETEGMHGLGSKWTPLNPGYDKWKRQHYPGAPMLVRSGAMREAFLVDGTRELTSDRLLWGITDQTNDEGERIGEYARAHQTGRGVVPQRKIVALGSMDRRQIDRIFVEWLHRVRRELFGAQR
jgi:hypothetical protein